MRQNRLNDIRSSETDVGIASASPRNDARMPCNDDGVPYIPRGLAVTDRTAWVVDLVAVLIEEA